MKNTIHRRLANQSFFNFLFFISVILLVAVLSGRASVIGWGTNQYGQLTIPTNLVGAKAIASGYWHGLAVTKSNTVVAWGLNDFGQTNVPPELTNVVAVAGGDSHSLALSQAGAVVGWGVKSNDYNPDPFLNFYFGQTDIPADLTNATAISAGAFHSLALQANGTVRAWGYNFYKQCDVPAGLSNVVAIACGGYFSLALKNDGTVVAWGDNYYGQTNPPADLTNVVSIAAGGFHGLALKADGTVAGWGASGNADYGQENPPSNLTNVINIAAGSFHSLALKSDGTVRQWGDTSLGQTNPPASLNSVLAIAGGYAHSYALNSDKPVLLNQPTNVVTVTNRAVSFSVKVSGALPIRATWWRTGSVSNLASVVISNTPATTSFTGGSVSGNVTNQLIPQTTLNLLATYSALTNAGTNSFYVVFTNALGSVTSSVATLTVLLPPKIVSQPVNVATNVGATVFFTVGTSGSQPLSYQWFFNGTNLNLTNPTNVLELDNVSTNDAGNYRLVITNPVGSVTSSVSKLTLLVNGAMTAPQLWLLNHDPQLGDGIMIALEAGRNYRVQSSVDLLNWNDVTNFLSQSSLIIFTNSQLVDLPSLYYRVVTP